MEKYSAHLPWMWAPESDGAGGKPVKSPDTVIITRGDDCEEEVLRFEIGDLAERFVQAFQSGTPKKISGSVEVGLTIALVERLRGLANTLESSVLRQPSKPTFRLELISVLDLDLTVRTTNQLMKESITNVAELLQYSGSDLRKFPNIGTNSLREIQAAVNQYGGLPKKSLVDIWSDEEQAKRSR